MRRSRVSPLVVLTLLMLACGGDPWKIDGAPKVPPDYQYRTGTEAGADIFEWTCYEGHHVIISQSGSACYVMPPRMRKLPCGTPVGWDDFRDASLGRAHDIPESYRWPSSDAGPVPYDAGANPAPSADSSASPAP